MLPVRRSCSVLAEAEGTILPLIYRDQPPASEDGNMGTIEDDLERIKREISQKLEETETDIERISGAGTSEKQREPSAMAGGHRLMDNTSQCAYACPACLRSCSLTLGHLSSHQCSEGHTWL